MNLDQLLAKLQDKTPFKAVAMSKWNTSLSPLASYAMPNSWFDELGAFDAGSVNTGGISGYVSMQELWLYMVL